MTGNIVKKISEMRGSLLHFCVICSLICITAKILDYYNPYMDFSGHTYEFQIGLYASVILLEVTRSYKKKRKNNITSRNFKFV